MANHDYIFWCGDFNYRIDLSGDEVKDLVKAKSWDKLRENDQLLVQKKMKNVFKVSKFSIKQELPIVSSLELKCNKFYVSHSILNIFLRKKYVEDKKWSECFLAFIRLSR